MIKKCKKCGKIIGKNKHICSSIPWNKGLKNWMPENSKQRMIKSKLGKPTWNKGTHGLMNTWNKGTVGMMKAWNKGKKYTEEEKKKLNMSGLEKGRGLFKNKKRPELSEEKHWNWKGGISDENHRIRTSLEIKLWRKAVLERDNFICQKYDTKGGILRVHHINNFAEFPELRFAIDNGITLSDKAHREFHHIYGTKNNTREQIIEFLR